MRISGVCLTTSLQYTVHPLLGANHQIPPPRRMLQSQKNLFTLEIYRTPLLILGLVTHNYSITSFADTCLARDPSPITEFPLLKGAASSTLDYLQTENSKAVSLLDAVVLPEPKFPPHLHFSAQEPSQYSPPISPIDSDDGVPGTPHLPPPTLQEEAPYRVRACLLFRNLRSHIISGPHWSSC